MCAGRNSWPRRWRLAFSTQRAHVFGRALGEGRFVGRVAVVKRMMGNKTCVSRSASERKDLDVLQLLIDMPPDFRPPLGLQVDVAIDLD